MERGWSFCKCSRRGSLSRMFWERLYHGSFVYLILSTRAYSSSRWFGGFDDVAGCSSFRFGGGGDVDVDVDELRYIIIIRCWFRQDDNDIFLGIRAALEKEDTPFHLPPTQLYAAALNRVAHMLPWNAGGEGYDLSIATLKMLIENEAPQAPSKNEFLIACTAPTQNFGVVLVSAHAQVGGSLHVKVSWMYIADQ